MTIIDATHSREIFAPLFKDLRTWHAWEVYLHGMFGLELERRIRAGGKDLGTHNQAATTIAPTRPDVDERSC